MKDDSNASVDAFILANLPNTFGNLWRRAEGKGCDWYRPIDRRLQALRKKGVVVVARENGKSIWRVAA